MFIEFATTQDSVESPAIRLKEVYHLHADGTYWSRKGANKELTGYVIIRTTGGLGRIRVSGAPEIVLEPDTLLTTEYSTIIDYRPAGGRWDFWWFAFDHDGLFMLPLNECQKLPSLPEEDELMANGLAQLQGGTMPSKLLASVTMGQLLGYWMRHTQASASFFHRSSLDGLLRHIHSHLDDSLTVAELARMCSLSTRQLYNVFFHAAGASPKNYILRLRMEKGAYLLRNTNQPVAEIAFALGYSDPLYFSRAFRNRFGLSPMSYRSGNRKKEDNETGRMDLFV